ncbi:MAG: GatB/YqeY domain-containing protein, partial [Alphaproteobacteria bacterium]
GVISGADELKIIHKLVKQRKESATIYQQQVRIDLYENEMAE